jgi:hypothetical protein
MIDQNKRKGLMNWNERGSGLPKSVAQKLRAIRRRAITLTLLKGLALTASVLIAAVLLAMIVDSIVGWFDPRARLAVPILTIIAAAAAFVFWCIRPLARRRTIVSTAREVDQTMPQLEERWSTVTEIAQSHDTPEVRGSETMIGKVASEAESTSANIRPEEVVPAKPLLIATRWLAGAAALFALFFVINFSQGVLLLQRFLMPHKNISLTQVHASPGNVWVAKGEGLTLNATLNGRVPKSAPKLFLRATNGAVKQLAMTAKTSATQAFQHSIDDVSDSFEYRVRAGDGQSPWLRIDAVDRPRISEVKLKITPPAYSKLPEDEKSALPNAIRVLQGSALQASFRSDQPLDRMLLDFGNGQSTQLAAASDNWYEFRTIPTNSFTFAAAAINKFKLENKTKPSCRVSVYEDLPPSVKVVEPSDEIAVLPGEKVNVIFEAADDLGLAKAEVLVETTKTDGETNSVKIPVDLGADAGKKGLRKSVELDTKALGLKHGDQLTYTVQVTDTRQTLASATVQPPQPESQLADAKEDQGEKESKNSENKEANSEPRDAKPSSNNNQNSQLAKAAQSKSSEQKPNQGSQRPPDHMERRMLDAGQSAECKPRNISVDEWAGSYEGQKRKKLEIAIDPILKRLDELLAKAQENTDALKQEIVKAPLDAGKKNIADSRKLVDDLKGRTSGTPYAFIGLQLYNIDQAHISPAGKSLDQITIPGETNLAHIEKASFHIASARKMLADLTRTYETVKRDQQIADAMQKLQKMHQIFLEDTQALLGGAKSPINSYDRKIAEVDDAFVEKLKALLEEKKKIMAELAKLLSEDPRMLRRYLAMLDQQATSYRDQLTLLTERQKVVQQQIAKWNATPETDRAALLDQLRQAYASQQREVLQDAAKLRENMETWLPLDVKTDQPQVQTALARAEKVVQCASTNATSQALNELRALRETIPQLSEIQSTNKVRMTTYVANRIPEVERLITAQSGQMAINEALEGGDFPRVGEIVQHRLTQDTITLEGKLSDVETQVAGMSEEIAKKAEMLNQLMQVDIIERQHKSVDELAAREMKPAEELIKKLPPAFDLAEKTFDELMRLIIDKLDQAPPPNSPGDAPGLDSILAMLEDEQKAREGLGIPCRPLNVSLLRDWMRPSSSSGQGQGQGRAQAEAAQAQAQEGKARSQRLERQARESAKNAMAEAQRNAEAASPVKSRNEAWNKLVSQLQKDLLQGRDNTPPEQYRQAIENYFKIISENNADAQK